ncbi:hypothetical protein N9M10_04990 [Hellea sp.]|nr:hypothetical protein [Hellea sp.]
MNIPYRFRMNISVADVKMDILVNEIIVFDNYKGLKFDTTIPLTIFINPGQNTIGVTAFTGDESYGANPRVKAEIEAQEFNGKGDWFPVTSLEFSGKASEAMEDQGLQKSRLGLARNFTAKLDRFGGLLDIRKEFSLDINMSEWNWSRSQVMTENSPELATLKTTYVDYYNLLKNMNPDSGLREASLAEMKARLSELLNDQAQAYNMTSDEVFGSMGIASTTKDPDMTLMSLGDPEDWEVELSANGRLAVFYPPDRDTILAYEFKEGGFYSKYPLRFRYDGQKWIPSR